MCYWDGCRAKILTVSKRKPMVGWRVMKRTLDGQYHSVHFSGRVGGHDVRPGRWVRASRHGFYVFQQPAHADAQLKSYVAMGRDLRVVKVAIAGRVRYYKGQQGWCVDILPGFRVEWMKVLP